jgi:hypothetical protein
MCMTGTAARQAAARLHAEQVIALTLEHGNGAAVRALADTVANLAPLVLSILEHRQDEAFRSIIEALVPDVPLPQHKLIEARMTAEARKAVLQSGDWLTAAQIAEMAGFSASNPSAQPNKWKKDGQIFAVPRLPDRRCRPRPCTRSLSAAYQASGRTRCRSVWRG